MEYKNLSKEELLKVAERQESIIKNYESVSSLYRRVKTFPLIGRTARAAANVFKAGKANGVRIIDHIDGKVETVAVCNPDFALGVRAATFALTSSVVEVSELLNRKAAKKAAKKILLHQPKKIVISGYSLGYDLLAEELKREDPKLRIFIYIHSAFIWFDVYPGENGVFNRMLELAKSGVVEKIGFCKRDVAQYFKARGVNAFFVMNRFVVPEKEPKKINKTKKIKIGVFGANQWHRNILNQTIAALMVPNAEVHVNEISNHPFLDQSRIVVHGFLPKEEFNHLFAQMDLNLYVSLTDCFPMNLIESMAAGIPAIASDTSDVYSFNPKLKKSLVLSTIDGPIGIAAKIEEVLENYREIQKEIKNYLPQLKGKVEKSIEEFLA